MKPDAELTHRARIARRRVWIMFGAGAAVAVLTGIFSSWWHAPAAGWGAAALVYDVWVWVRIAPMSPEETRVHARQEDPRRSARDFLILSANVAAIVAVVIVIVSGNNANGPAKAALAFLALTVVAASWLMLHTIFTLRYTELYYATPEGGIDFNQDEPPQYTDIAYMAFSLGMTYQVSDTAIRTRAIRTEALKHSLLAYVFATLILAATINLVIGLAG
ncbi:DUF1345 domain-containing protein [Sinomonas atrocyanea]|uniref:DUF1345 domain-containing protein n=1 Tax=Sinomonas atrocyanea TaxID=37927 RepID=UPI00277D5D34|nr:DUF1345 domain-containing protein [Sinomonas atrocyanea]MDQ0260708.1 putative membrane protein [Sinomonas atrocyanea]MDR6622309.1 putative membrane protein [Sinomonas atrocyanea]